MSEQAYPTVWAYEQVCAARDKWQARAEAAEAEVASLKEEFSTRIFHYDERIAELQAALRNPGGTDL